MSVRSDSCVTFGPFRLFPNARTIEKDGMALQLGSRALDILIVLVERAGEVVSQKELISRVWRGLRVDPSALRVQMTALRKALGDGRNGARYVATVPGQGYSFVAPKKDIDANEAPPLAQLPRPPQNNPSGAPPTLARMVGRDETVSAIIEELLQRRFVTLVGPGGIGKTTVAAAVAHRLLKSAEGFVCFVDLSAVADPSLIIGTVAASLGLEFNAQDALPNLLESLSVSRGVLFLDNCEHVIGQTAALAEQIVLHAPGIHILATSREALRVEGEYLYELAPLACPPAGSSPNAATAQSFAAVQLFMDRANARGGRLQLSDADAPIVADICNRLDGIALAIELAAGRVGTYGIRGISSLLSGRLELSWRGKRTATPRHQTLYALLDWSYELLPETERVVLRRLSVFVGPFNAAAAVAVVGADNWRRMVVAESLEALVAKSLLSTVVGSDGVALYRLLETTRAYAAEKLYEYGEMRGCAKRHAIYFLDFLTRTADERKALRRGNWLATGNSHLGNVRAALEWCFDGDGDDALGVALAARAAPLFLSLSLISEGHRWSVQALAHLDATQRGTERELDLQEAMAISSTFIRGERTDVMRAFLRGLELAQALDKETQRLRLLSGLHHYLMRAGEFQAALAVSQQWREAASTTQDGYSTAVSDWMLAISYHLTGDQAAAHRHCESGFAHDSVHPSDCEFSGFDHRVRALVTLARTLWLRGYATQSLRTARRALEVAAQGDRPVNVCLSLVYAIPVFMWCGDWNAAAELIDRLINYAPRYGFGPWRAVGDALKGEFLVRTGNFSRGIALLESGLRLMKLEQYRVQAGILTGALAEGFGKAGRMEQALTTITAAIEEGELNGDPYDMPELLRIKGELLSSGPKGSHAEAEQYLRRSLDLAHRQSAVGWELRAATALARVLASNGHYQEALAVLEPVYSQLTEGFETVDPSVAADLLASLSRSDRRVRSGVRRSGTAGQS